MRWIFAIVLGGLLLAGGAAGCERPLFPETMPRTQYERYDKLRGQYSPRQEPRRRGGDPQPNLRQRLRPYN